MTLGTVILFGLLGFVFQLMALTHVKHTFFRWFPAIFLEGFLTGAMINHKMNPPSLDVLGYQVYWWLIFAVALGVVLAWRFHKKQKR